MGTPPSRLYRSPKGTEYKPMSIRRRRRNKGKRRTGDARAAAPLPRVRQGPVKIPKVSSSSLPQTPTAIQGPDYAYVKRDMIWMLAVSIILFGAMMLLAPFL